MTHFDDINYTLSEGRAAMKSFLGDTRLDSDYREKLAHNAWATAVKDARTAADGMLRRALDRRHAADKGLQAQLQAWEDATDFPRLTAAYDRVRTLIAHAAEPEDVLRFTRQFPTDRHIQRALAEAGPRALQQRIAQGGPAWQRGAISPLRLGREATQRLTELEPAALKAARAEVEASHLERRETLAALSRADSTYARESGARSLFTGLGDMTVKEETERGYRLTTGNAYQQLYDEERGNLSASISGELEG